MRTFSSCMCTCSLCSPDSSLWLLDAVVRRLLGDDDVVDGALAEPAGGDANEARVLPQLLDGAAAGVPHAAPDAAEHLVHVHRQAALVRDAALHALGDELLLLLDIALEV